MNNKTNIIAKTLIAGLACVAFCGATLAYPLAEGHPAGAAMGGAPHGGGKAPQKYPPTEGRCEAGAMRGAPTHQKTPAPNGGNARAHNPAPRVAAPCGQPAAGGYPAPHGAPVAHHAPAPAPHHHEPPPAPHHGGHHGGAGWVALGATVIGGIVGGIIGACN